MRRICPYLFFFVVPLLLLFTTCKKKETSDPVLTYVLPVENQNFKVLDTIHVVADISAAEIITGVNVTLTDADLLQRLATIALYPGKKDYHLDVSLPVNDISLPSGKYYVLVQAFTANSSKNKYQAISLNEVPRRLNHIFLLTRTNVNTTSLVMIDSLYQMHTVYQFPSDYSHAGINSLKHFLYMTGSGTGKMFALDLDSLRVVWSAQGSGTSSLPYYQDVFINNGLLFLSSVDGKITAYDHTGSIEFYTFLNSPLYPCRLFQSDNYLFSNVLSRSGPESYLYQFRFPGGALWHHRQITYKIVDFFKESTGKIIILGNVGSNGIIEINDPLTGTYTQPVAFPAEKIISSRQTDPGYYMIAAGTEVLWFNYQQYSLTTFIPNVHPVAIRFEDVSRQVIIAENNKISFYSYPGASLLKTINVPDTIRDCLLYYNK